MIAILINKVANTAACEILHAIFTVSFGKDVNKEGKNALLKEFIK